MKLNGDFWVKAIFSTFLVFFTFSSQSITNAENEAVFQPVSGANWEFRVLAVENTGKQSWKSWGPKLGREYRIKINEDAMTFWRIKAEVIRKRRGLDFDSQWVKLIYRLYKGEQKNAGSAAMIMDIMGEKVASSGNFNISFGRKKLSEPLDLDLLFVAPLNSNDIEYMHLQFLDYDKVRLIPPN